MSGLISCLHKSLRNSILFLLHLWHVGLLVEMLTSMEPTAETWLTPVCFENSLLPLSVLYPELELILFTSHPLAPHFVRNFLGASSSVRRLRVGLSHRQQFPVREPWSSWRVQACWTEPVGVFRRWADSSLWLRILPSCCAISLDPAQFLSVEVSVSRSAQPGLSRSSLGFGELHFRPLFLRCYGTVLTLFWGEEVCLFRNIFLVRTELWMIPASLGCASAAFLFPRCPP